MLYSISDPWRFNADAGIRAKAVTIRLTSIEVRLREVATADTADMETMATAIDDMKSKDARASIVACLTLKELLTLIG